MPKIGPFVGVGRAFRDLLPGPVYPAAVVSAGAQVAWDLLSKTTWTNITPTKRFGVDALPTGWTSNGVYGIVTSQHDPAPLSGWILDRVVCIRHNGAVIEDFKIDLATTGYVGGYTIGTFMIRIAAAPDNLTVGPIIQRGTIDMGGRSEIAPLIPVAPITEHASATTIGTTVRDVYIRGSADDAIKLVGTNKVLQRIRVEVGGIGLYAGDPHFDGFSLENALGAGTAQDIVEDCIVDMTPILGATIGTKGRTSGIALYGLKNGAIIRRNVFGYNGETVDSLGYAMFSAFFSADATNTQNLDVSNNVFTSLNAIVGGAGIYGIDTWTNNWRMSPRGGFDNVPVTAPVNTLKVLTLSAATIAENTVAGTTIGALQKVTPGSTLSLFDDAGGKVALSGNNLLTGLTNIDFETTPTFNITVRETLAGSIGSPKNTVFTITATDVVEGPVTDAAVTNVRSDGWSIDFTSPPTFDPIGSPKYVVVDEPGFTASGGDITRRETRIITTRCRVPWTATRPIGGGATVAADFLNANLATYGLWESTRCAMNMGVSLEAVLVGASGGATMGSTERVPKPIGQWIWPDTEVVGNTIPRHKLAMVAAHYFARAGEQLACAEWRVTDGTNTVTVRNSVSEIAGGSMDQNPIVCYMPSTDVDISTLNNNVVLTVYGAQYPWIGQRHATYANSSILDSEFEAGRNFLPLKFWKNTTRAGAPNYACVDPVSGTAGGVVSATKATAEATPYQTLAQAATALRTSRGGAGSDIGGDIICLKGNVAPANLATISANYNTNSSLIFEAATGYDRTNAGLTISANFTFTEVPGLWLRNIYLKRTGATPWLFSCKTGGFKLTFENCAYDGNSLNGSMCAQGSIVRHLGTAFTNIGGNATLAPSANSSYRLFRGCTGNALTMEKLCVVGGTFTASTASIGASYSESGNFVGYNKFHSYTSTNPAFGSSGNANPIVGMAYIQNVFEWCTGGVSQNAMLRSGGDDDVLNITHLVVHNNTYLGALDAGRWNVLYNETTGTAKTHKWASVIGNVTPQLNTKHDVFHATSDGQPGESPGYTGGFAFLHGVGCRGNYIRHVNAQNYQNGLGDAYGQLYAGMQTVNGTATTSASAVDLRFINYQATTRTTVYVSGTGAGNYDLNTASPLRLMVTDPVLKFDLAGRTRPASNDTCGAYHAAA